MPATSDQRALATALAAQGDAELAALFARRGVPASATWRDFFDAAEGMLEHAALARGLAALHHAPAAALARAVAEGAPVAARARETLARAGLCDADGTVFQAAAAVVRERDPVADDRPAPAEHADAAASAAAAERAFTSTASLADILLRTLDAPLGRIGNGGLGAADRRALVDSGAAADPDTADLLVGLADAVGLVVAADRSWLATGAARDWVTAPTIERWASVAERLREALPGGLRTADGGWLPTDSWTVAYPFDPSWPARAETWRARLYAWGLLTREGAQPAWTTPLARGERPDVDALQALLPVEVDRVFLQNDLTAIAPGPLAPHLDVRLRGMARRESRAQASTYRFDADSVSAAITAGESASSLRSFLSALSLTGVPQPLQYVIDRTATRHGLVRVSTDGDTGRARVSSDEPGVVDTIAVDQALRPLGLARDGGGLVSRLPAESVFWALADARYPVVAVDADGLPRRVDRTRLAEPARTASAAETYAPLIARLRASATAGDGDAAWLERELDQAVRARAVIDVVVALPDGSERTFRLEATGLGGGRLRGRDRAADVERTLPLRSIRSVHPAG